MSDLLLFFDRRITDSLCLGLRDLLLFFSQFVIDAFLCFIDLLPASTIHLPTLSRKMIVTL